MSKKIIYLLLAVSLGLNAGVIAMTLMHRPPSPMQGPPQGPGGPGGPGAGEMGRRPDPGRMVEEHLRGMSRHLGLDSGQQAAIRAALERHSPDLTAAQVDAAEAGRRLADAFGAPVFDPEQFRQLASETAVARSRADSLAAVLLAAEAAVLTPEQRREFAKVAPTIHNNPQRSPGRDGPPPRKRP